MFFSSQGLWYGESEFQRRGQYFHSCLFFRGVSFCRLLLFSSRCSNSHFSNEYKYLFCECLSSSHFGCFSTIKVFVGAAGCNAKASLSHSLSLPLSLLFRFLSVSPFLHDWKKLWISLLHSCKSLIIFSLSQKNKFYIMKSQLSRVTLASSCCHVLQIFPQILKTNWLGTPQLKASNSSSLGH